VNGPLVSQVDEVVREGRRGTRVTLVQGGRVAAKLALVIDKLPKGKRAAIAGLIAVLTDEELSK
jgi:hypothetical protein